MTKNNFKTLFLPQGIYNKTYKILFLLFFIKFLFFDFIWCLSSTFRSFSTIECYLNKILIVLILMLPYVFYKSRITEIIIAFVLDMLFISNLMYFRTYNCQIPLSSYAIANNLTDFMESVFDSMRWYDIFFPISTIIGILLTKKRVKEISALFREKMRYCLVCLVVLGLSGGLILYNGGVKKAYESILDANQFTCVTPMYTIFGIMMYDAVQEGYKITNEDLDKIENFLKSQPEHASLPDNINYNNFVFILLESFESWQLESAPEGKEITPYINKLLKDSTTFYAPKVLSQVKGARSIDAQLLINAGLLPISSGAYCIKHPSNEYLTLTKAMKEKYGTKGYLCSVDKEMTWNQKVVAESFGFDTLLFRYSFKHDEKVGPRKKLGDRSFFKQCVQKMKNGEIWPQGENAFIQFVTYSGHNPFVLQKELHQIEFSEKFPKRVSDYMIMANYTDSAVKELIEYLKSRPDYANTLIVITGDHEGFTKERTSLISNKLCKGLVSEKQYTPLIILNSPIAGRYNKVMGQIDVYPTLLNLLKLDNYKWKGLGMSIFDKDKKAIAVGPQFNVENEEVGDNSKLINNLTKSWEISDLIIKGDYFSKDSLWHKF